MTQAQITYSLESALLGKVIPFEVFEEIINEFNSKNDTTNNSNESS